MAADPKRPVTADPGKNKPATGPTGEAVDERLAPLEEFRGRSESWMKEITGQVARLASRNEEEDRRRKNLDKRLGDIEQRIQSLLTLTEMLSMGSNPFVASAETRPKEVAPPPAPTALYAAPPAAPATPSPPPASAPAPAAPVAVPAPPGPPAVPASPKAAAPAPELVRFEAAGPEDEDDGAAAVAPALTPGRAPPGPSARRAEGADASYFRDLLSGAPTAQPPAPPTPEPGRPPASPHESTVERLVLLEWAELLASRLPRGHLHAFLSRYEEAGWIDGHTLDRVLALASGLEVGTPDAPSPQDLHDLHVRSLVLLSFLEGRPIPQSAALEVLTEARATTHGDWADALR